MNEKFMLEAIKEARKAYKKGEVPIGAVIVQGDKIIGRGHNLVESEKNSLRHAELIAIEEASKNLKGWRLIDSTMYVTLEPCPMCAGAIVNSRIDKLVIGTSDKKRGACGSNLDITNENSLNHKVEIYKSKYSSECSNMLSEFFKEIREKKK